jgi:uncharacterized protein
MKITALYAALLAVLFLVLTVRTLSYRRTQKVEIGDGGDKELLRRVRVHGNFAEYVPIALILIGMAESLGLAATAVHGLGLLLLLGRAVHAYGLSQSPHILVMRVAGMLATLLAIAVAAAACAWFSLH